MLIYFGSLEWNLLFCILKISHNLLTWRINSLLIGSLFLSPFLHFVNYNNKKLS